MRRLTWRIVQQLASLSMSGVPAVSELHAASSEQIRWCYEAVLVLVSLELEMVPPLVLFPVVLSMIISSLYIVIHNQLNIVRKKTITM